MLSELFERHFLCQVKAWLTDAEEGPAGLLALFRKCPEIDGAGEGNRTLVSGLGSPHSTIEPHPRPTRFIVTSDAMGAQGVSAERRIIMNA
jgi:hypothetical protein